MRLTGRKVAAILRQHGYKLTLQRQAVVRTIISSQDHLTPAAVHEKVHQSHPSIGLVTVYRTLDILARLGLICELHVGDSCRSYTISALGHHHHLICSNCGTVVDFPEFELGKMEQNLSRETGFRIDGHLLEVIGLCQACQKEAK
ncbi:MAG: Fur family transcriptional regulator [Dehalococcoidales bacterium]